MLVNIIKNKIYFLLYYYLKMYKSINYLSFQNLDYLG